MSARTALFLSVEGTIIFTFHVVKVKVMHFDVRQRKFFTKMLLYFFIMSDMLSRHVVFDVVLPMPYWFSVVFTPVLPLSNAPASRRETF